jgi:hypothetical protein
MSFIGSTVWLVQGNRRDRLSGAHAAVLPVHVDAATPEIDGCTTFRRRLTVMEDELPRFGTKKPIMPDGSPMTRHTVLSIGKILVQYGS